MSDHYLLIRPDDKRDPHAQHFDTLEELSAFIHEHSIQPDDPQHLNIRGGQVVTFTIPKPTIEIIGAPVVEAKKPRKPRADKGQPRKKANGADTEAVTQ